MIPYCASKLALVSVTITLTLWFSPTVGCTLTQSDTSDLKYLYEGHEDFSVIPSFAVIAAQVISIIQTYFKQSTKSCLEGRSIHRWSVSYINISRSLFPSFLPNSSLEFFLHANGFVCQWFCLSVAYGCSFVSLRFCFPGWFCLPLVCLLWFVCLWFLWLIVLFANSFVCLQGIVMNGSVFGKGIPGLKSYSLAQALHGEQHVEILKPLPTSGMCCCIG